MSTSVEQIKQRLSIVDVVGSYVKLEKAGSSLKGRCPFHNEKTPSFFVSPDRGTYYCFGCNAKGDIFEFVQNFEGLDFMGALKTLAQRAGVEIVRENPAARTEKERLYAIMEETCRFFQALLDLYPEARNYLKGRGLSDETIKEFRIGFIPDEWRKLHSHLRTKGYSDNDIEKVGLSKKSEAGYYDRFRGRIMFPINDAGGRVIAFSGRILGEGEPKYLNSPDTVLFNKSNVLYGIDKAKTHIRRLNFSILVEGQMDLIMSHQAGYRNTVAVSGTALTDSLVSKENIVNNLGLVQRLSNNMVLAFDADSAGLRAASRSAQIGLSLGMDIKIAVIKEGKDPADFILARPEGWKEIIKHSLPIIDFQIEQVMSQSNDSRKVAKLMRESVLPYIAVLGSRMEQAHFVKKVHQKTGIDEPLIWEDIARLPRAPIEGSGAVTATPAKTQEDDRRDSIGRQLVGVLYWQETVPESVINIGEIRQTIATIAGEQYLKTFEFKDEIEKSEVIFRAEVTFPNDDSLKKGVAELLTHFEEEHLKKLFSQKMLNLAEAERRADAAAATTILQECQALSRRLENLKRRA